MGYRRRLRPVGSILLALLAPLALLTSAPALASPGDDDFGGGSTSAPEPTRAPDEAPPTRAVAVPALGRPLTLPKGLFAIIGGAGWSKIDRNSNVVSLGVGARYGVEDDLEVGLDLLRLTLSGHPSTGLGDPLAHVTYRFTRGVAELGARAEVVVPTSTGYGAGVGLPFVLHLGGVARLELSPAIFAASGGRWVFSVLAPVGLRVQLGPRLTLGAAAALDVPNLEAQAVLLRPEARASWTFGDHLADADLSLVATAPELALRAERPADPWSGSYPTVLLELRLFMADDPRRDEGEHLW